MAFNIREEFFIKILIHKDRDTMYTTMEIGIDKTGICEMGQLKIQAISRPVTNPNMANRSFVPDILATPLSTRLVNPVMASIMRLMKIKKIIPVTSEAAQKITIFAQGARRSYRLPAPKEDKMLYTAATTPGPRAKPSSVSTILMRFFNDDSFHI